MGKNSPNQLPVIQGGSAAPTTGANNPNNLLFGQLSSSKGFGNDLVFGSDLSKSLTPT